MIVSVNPYTGDELARFKFFSAEEVDAALSDTASAQSKWRLIPLTGRANHLRSLARVLRSGKERYARLITLEMGKPIVESEAEIEKCAVTCDYYAEHGPDFLADEIVASNASESAVVFDPLGVVLAIMPWNYPFWQFVRFAAPALMAGNGAILKHANNVPQCAKAIEAAIRDAGFPNGLVRSLFVEAEKVAEIIADDRIAAVTLTGSTQVGSIVAAQAGRRLKKQVLELGGSDPFIVLADADVDQAATVAVKARFINVGQSCVNAKRFIVEDRVADLFVDSFVAGVRALKIGNPMERDTQIGPMARENLRAELHRQVEATVSAGATLKLGGKPAAGAGFMYEPTVIDYVKPAMVAFQEETFGPAAAVIRSASADEAISLANRTEFGLGASLWTRDIGRARSLARRIDAGAVFINGMVASDARLPFGGIKRSGYGRELGVYGIKEFTNIKTLWIGPARA
jgi:succinate-semialdehyde dehydrogenase/glutarate-semialdehyde dehydrogenase